MTLEAGLFLSVATAACAVMIARGARLRREGLAIAAVAIGLSATTLLLWEPPRRPAPPPGIPRPVPTGGYVSSETCRRCHPSQHASWHRSYHRTMTQVATPETVLGDFDDVVLEARGRSYRLSRAGDEYWVEMVDPDWDFDTITYKKDRTGETPPRRRCRVVLTTGSHHQQTYWVAIGGRRGLMQLTWSWIRESARWAPREDVFLGPYSEERMPAVWNHRCIKCHATHGRPNLDLGNGLVTDSEVAELGIACEACHGPAAKHVEANRSPWRRYRLHLTGGGDDTIVNPARLDQHASSEVCGQCHSFHQRKDRRGFLVKGAPYEGYRPGDDLHRTRDVEEFDAATGCEGRYWSDGSCRVGGREYNGMVASACFQRGEMTCLSCHTMHGDDPDGQLIAPDDSDRSCVQCHPGYDDRRHTHHDAGSPGSRCYECHMPHVGYALLGALRSHRIDSPAAGQHTRFGRPVACNLCHLDRTLAWTSRHLADWYGQAEPELTDEQSAIAVGPLLATSGDALQRALMAWCMSWEPALEASTTGWMPPHLIELMADSYTAVRYIAHRSLSRHPGLAGLGFDFVGPAVDRERDRRAAAERWKRVAGKQPLEAKASLLIDGSGIDRAAFARLRARRDETPVAIQE